MPLITEQFNGGIVSSRDPTALVPGELQQANECVYRIHDTAIYSRPGRTQYNTTTIKDAGGTVGPVKGLSYLSFEGIRTDQIVALGGNDNGLGTLWAGDFTSISGAATFTKLTGPGQVTDASINNSTTVTSASNGFTNMVAGARIIGTGIPVNSFVTVVNSPSNITISNTTTGGAQVVTASFDMGIAVSPNDAGTEVLDAVQWGQIYYATGFGELTRIFYKKRSVPTGTTFPDLLIARSAGLYPVVVQPTVARVAGTWPSVLGNGFYWFLVTEIYNPDQDDEVEGTYVAKDTNGTKLGPVVGQITDFTSQTFQITFPAQVNIGNAGRLSTHWGIYMSPKQQDGTTVPSISTFRRVATAPITFTTLTLTDTSTSTNPTQSKYPTASAVYGSRTQFTNPSNMLNAPNGTIATGTGSAANANILQTFGFSTGAPYNTGTITGIRVIVTARCTGLVGGMVGVTLLTTGGKKSSVYLKPINNLGLSSFTLGDQFDTWGVAWVPADFADGTFQLAIEVPNTISSTALGVDAVQVVVYYSGGSINLNGKPFRVITYRDQIGFTIDEPANNVPPASNTLDIFQGSIVSNDLNVRNSLRWSLPGAPEAWPAPYVLAFTERKSDLVTCIRRLGQVLVVGTRTTVRRINYLPSEIDTDFRRGLAHEIIRDDGGIAGPLAAATFSRTISPYSFGYVRYGGGGTHLAYVSYDGIHMTDGVTSTYLTHDIRIADYIDPAFIQNCVFRNYAKEQWLVLFYTPVGGTRNTKALIFTYDQPKEDGTLRVIGPISVSARSACEATLAGVPILLTGHQFGGTIWTEDQGDSLTGYTLDGATQLVATPSIITRRFYPAGIDHNARVERQYFQHDASGTQTSLSNVVMTAGSTTITRSPNFGSVIKGMRIVHVNIPGDTIVVSVAGGTITMSQPAFTTLTDAVIFDSGTISVTVRAQSIGTTITNVATTYSSTFTGGLLKTDQDAHAQSFDMMIEKVRMPDSSLFDLNVRMRLFHFSWDASDAGKEQTRSGVL